MLFPKFVEGLEAVLFIALHSGADPVSSKQICSYQEVLPRHLEPVLQILVKEGILKGTKGPRGGYTLAKEKRKVSIDKIFNLLAKETLVKNTKKSKESNLIRNHLTIKLNDEIAKNIQITLHNLTLEDLCKQMEDKVQIGTKSSFDI